MENQENIMVLKDSLKEKMKTFNKIRSSKTDVFQKQAVESSNELKSKSSLNISNLGTSFFGRRRR